MKLNLTGFFAAALGGIALSTAVFAQDTTSPTSPPTTGMGQHGGMTGMTGQMNPEAMKDMMRMADNCNHMMESMNKGPTGPGKQESAPPHN